MSEPETEPVCLHVFISRRCKDCTCVRQNVTEYADSPVISRPSHFFKRGAKRPPVDFSLTVVSLYKISQINMALQCYVKN